MLTIYTGSQATRVLLSEMRRRFGKARYCSNRVSPVEFVSLLSYMKGDPCEMDCVDSLLRKVTLDKTPSGYAECNEEKLITLQGDDGLCTVLNRSYIEHFTLLADYFDEYRETSIITLPYSTSTIREALAPFKRTHAKLAACLDCVKYLNPTRNTYYLDFILTDVLPSEMVALASYFTEAERDELRLLHECQEDCLPLPNLGRDHGILCASQAVKADLDLCHALFQDYPSWLYYHTLRSRDDDPRTRHLLFNGDFTREVYLSGAKSFLKTSICSYMRQIVMKDDLTWDELKHILLLVGVSSFLGEENVCAPYGTVLTEENVSLPVSSAFLKLYPGDDVEGAWGSLLRANEGRSRLW